jgi:hypothetical protein
MGCVKVSFPHENRDGRTRIDLELLLAGFIRGETATGLELLALTRTLRQNERARCAS